MQVKRAQRKAKREAAAAEAAAAAALDAQLQVRDRVPRQLRFFPCARSL